MAYAINTSVTVNNNLGPDCLAGTKVLDPNYCRQPTPLIARPLSGSPNCAWYNELGCN